ncbi:cathelicidin-3-like [Engystomops pustulosus]|uniref:cathelicidin-3-like n=1 Tax=Engystomops pustulosus TaxID=76066 RepID=UPI003AFB6E2E
MYESLLGEDLSKDKFGGCITDEVSEDNFLLYQEIGNAVDFTIIQEEEEVETSEEPRDERAFPPRPDSLRMWGLSLLLVSAVTLHGCLSDAAEAQLHHGRSIEDVIHLYNQREGVTYLYKALDPRPPALLEEDEIPDTRTIIIKETACRKPQHLHPSQCDHKPDGEVKVCVLDLDVVDPEEIMCRSLTKKVPVKRNRRPRPRPRPGGNTILQVDLSKSWAISVRDKSQS